MTKHTTTNEQLIEEEEMKRLRTEIAGAVARGYCYVENSKKVLDPDLLKAIGRELEILFKKELSTIASKSAESERNRIIGEIKMGLLGIITSVGYSMKLSGGQIMVLSRQINDLLKALENKEK